MKGIGEKRIVRAITMLAVTTLTLMGWHSHASAAVITFSEKEAFLAATGAASATGPLPNLGSLPSDTASVGSVTFRIAPPSSSLHIGALNNPNVRNGDFTLITPGHDIAIGGVEHLNIEVASPVFALGFDFVEPADADCYSTCFDSTFTVTLKDGEETIGMFTFNAPNDVLAFIGVWSDTPFTRVEIRDTTATVDDEYFGEVFTGTTPASLPDIAGCIQLREGPLMGRPVVLKQTDEPDQTTNTDAAGCYTFDTAVSGKRFSVTIKGPVVP